MDNAHILQLRNPGALLEVTGWLMAEPDLEAISHSRWQLGLSAGGLVPRLQLGKCTSLPFRASSTLFLPFLPASPTLPSSLHLTPRRGGASLEDGQPCP